MEIISRYFPDLNKEQITKFEQLKSIYEDWNSKINVISRKDMDAFNTRHLLHSLALTKFINPIPGSSIMDIGTGGGFPGIPLAIYYPDVEFTLVDSIGKKIRVVNEVISALSLSNAKGIQSRFEELRKPVDLIVSRAVARTLKLVQLTGKSRKKSSVMALLKGGNLLEERDELWEQYPRTLWKEYSISECYSEPFFETKKVVLLSKIG